jgi:pimeloyl-ACP methyl ester carboxylesterase
MYKTHDTMSARTIELHGRSFAYRHVGAGPVVVLVHGLAGTMGTWDAVVDDLATRCTVVTVDLPGHGRSEPLPGDSSIGTYANALRDLLDALEHPTATVVGHSLGGGVALQFAYQYPQRCERLVLVSSGGLGVEVSAILRAAALP